MSMIGQKLGPVKMPEVPQDAAFSEAKKQRDGARADMPDFNSLLVESNAQKKAEQDLEAQKVGAGGEIKIGETKTDKEFREMLEKITGKKQDKLKNKLEKDDYLNLMVTQLKHQDPTKPMDNQEMAQQLASFNTVEQLMSMDKTLKSMHGQQNAAQVDKLTPYLGRTIDVVGSQFKVGSDRSVSGAAVELPSASSAAGVVIKDHAGQTVRTLALGNLESGRHKIEWDGKDDKGNNAPAGHYTFSVDASAVDGKPISAKSFFSAKVEGITDLASGGKLETSSGAVELKDIIAIRADDPVKATAQAQSPMAVTKPSAVAAAGTVAGASAAPAANAAPVASAGAATGATTGTATDSDRPSAQPIANSANPLAPNSGRSPEGSPAVPPRPRTAAESKDGAKPTASKDKPAAA